jgi:alkylated DNA nucleotide flippase Atl1
MHQAIYDHLKRVATARRVTTYGDVAPLAGLDPNAYNFFRILEEISSYEHRHGRPMLTAVVVSKEDQYPWTGLL